MSLCYLVYVTCYVAVFEEIDLVIAVLDIKTRLCFIEGFGEGGTHFKAQTIRNPLLSKTHENH